MKTGCPAGLAHEHRVPGDHQLFAASPGQHSHFVLWSPDQRFIYFVLGALPDRMDIWRLPAAGGTPERITHHESRVRNEGGVEARTVAVQLIPADAVRRVDGEGPAGCPF